MVRMLHAFSLLILALAGIVFVLAGMEFFDRELPVNCAPGPSLVELLRQSGGIANRADVAQPLVVQAQAFASYLNPLRVPEQVPVKVASRQIPTRSTPSISPPVTTPKFRLHGTSYYPARPERSMALIWELDGQGGSRRWVKEGAQLGHLVVHEIRQGSIVYRSVGGETTREMLVEHGPAGPSLVRQPSTELAQANSPHAPTATDADANMAGK